MEFEAQGIQGGEILWIVSLATPGRVKSFGGSVGAGNGVQQLTPRTLSSSHMAQVGSLGNPPWSSVRTLSPCPSGAEFIQLLGLCTTV